MDPRVYAGSHAHLRILPWEDSMRARSIKPGFFENETLAENGPYAQILFAGLWCLADKKGRLEDRPKRIKAKIFPYYDPQPSVEDLLGNLERLGFILRYSVDGRQIISVINFLRHQSPHHTEKESELPECPHGLNGGLTVNPPLSDGGNPPDSLTPDSLTPDSRKSGASCDEKPSPSPPKPVTPNPAPPHKRVTLDLTTHQWHGITQADMDALKSAYPACCVSTELLRAAEWVKANPEKRKSNWYRFLVNWMNRTQNGGGTKMARASPENKGPCQNPWENNPDYDPWRLQ